MRIQALLGEQVGMSSKNYEENLPRYLQSDKMEPSNISVIHLPKSDDHNNHEVTFEEALKIIGEITDIILLVAFDYFWPEVFL